VSKVGRRVGDKAARYATTSEEGVGHGLRLAANAVDDQRVVSAVSDTVVEVTAIDENFLQGVGRVQFRQLDIKVEAVAAAVAVDRQKFLVKEKVRRLIIDCQCETPLSARKEGVLQADGIVLARGRDVVENHRGLVENPGNILELYRLE